MGRMKTSTAVAELPVEQETANRETPKQENGQEIAVPQKATTSTPGPSPKGSRSKSQAKASAK